MIAQIIKADYTPACRQAGIKATAHVICVIFLKICVIVLKRRLACPS